MIKRTRKLKLPSPCAHQLEILISPAREKIVACGRRFGKTTLGMIAALLGHGERRGKWYKGALEGGRIWWVSPTYPMASEVWRWIKARIEPLLHAGYVEKDEQEMRLIFTQTGGIFEIKSAERADLLRGAGLDGVVQDEAAFQNERLYYSIIRPALADRKGWWIGLSTPNGYNWFHDKFEMTKARWRRTTFEAPWIDAEERENILRTYGGNGPDYKERAEADPRYRQEYLAEFVAESVGAFDPGWWKEYDELPKDGERRTIQSWDTAYGRGREGDYSVCVTVTEFNDGVYVRDVWRGRPPFPDLKATAIRLYDLFKPSLILIEDAASGQSLIQELRRGTHLPISPIKVDKDKQARVSAAQPIVSVGRVFLPRSAHWKDEFIRELAAFPSGKYDDQVDAFAQAINYLQFMPVKLEPRIPDVLLGGPFRPSAEEDNKEIDGIYGRLFEREAFREPLLQ